MCVFDCQLQPTVYLFQHSARRQQAEAAVGSRGKNWVTRLAASRQSMSFVLAHAGNPCDTLVKNLCNCQSVLDDSRKESTKETVRGFLPLTTRNVLRTNPNTNRCASKTVVGGAVSPTSNPPRSCHRDTLHSRKLSFHSRSSYKQLQRSSAGLVSA